MKWVEGVEEAAAPGAGVAQAGWAGLPPLGLVVTVSASTADIGNRK